MIRKVMFLAFIGLATGWLVWFDVTGAQAGLEDPARQTLAAMAPAAAPVRGVLGDWWADVVIGQPNFGQITPNEVVGNKLFNPGGVYVDRSAVPNRVYVYDAGNSRILGFSSLGTCAEGSKIGQACTSRSDCLGSACNINSTKAADIILGQPSSNSSACNGDSGFQSYPDFPAPTARTLCGLRPEGASILEGGSMATMATDAQGNLYHPDYLNNRVVRYNNPFNGDTAADYVWGQADFTHGECNEGRSYSSPDNNSLCLLAPLQAGSLKSGVAIDANGNLWVADTQNNRVLRFPNNPSTGVPAQVANLVLGQSNFTNDTAGEGPNQMTNPASVRVDPSGKVYVLDGIDGWGAPARLLVFNPPLSNGMSANLAFNRPVEPTGLELDASGQLWISESDSQQILRLVNGTLQPVISNTPYSSWGSLGIDRDGNVLIAGWDAQQVQIYDAPSYAWSSTFLQADELGSFNKLGPRGMTDPGGMEVTDQQLIVADQTRLLFWNNPMQLINNYPPADGVVGQPDFVTRPKWGLRYGRMRADTHGRLWVLRGDVDLGTQILAYQLPLVSQAQPIMEITSPLPLKGGGSFSWSGFTHLGGIAYQPDCDCLWVSDIVSSRVFRISQVSLPGRVVDIVLGQKSTEGVHCNLGRDSDDGGVRAQFPSRDSLCFPGGMALDRRGNLFVSDHNLEAAGNWRMLEYDAAILPLNPSTAVFGLPASRVYGRNGSFTEPNCQDGDPMCGPWEPVFYPNNDMVIGFNTYLGPGFPQVYHDPLSHPLPYTSLRDYYSHAYSARLDSLNNLYVLDMTRSHVLIYRAQELTFADVFPMYWAYDFIERLYNAGITGGCGTSPLQYCPETTVTRSQMAVFLLRGIHGSSYSPPALGGSTGFGDVPPNYWSAVWIKQLAAEGITGGCGSGNFCPEYPVTRDQMAVFLLRSKYGSSYSPPAVGTSTGFGDVPVGHWAAPWIKQLVTEGITAGCGNGNYCPGIPVSRAQMAVFLVRTFNLP